MSYKFITNNPKLHLTALLSLVLSGCLDSNKLGSPGLDGANHPAFVREKVATSNHYKPTGQISDSTPEFVWPKTVGATQYLVGHEDTETSTRWHEYIVTAEQANCNQANASRCSYTPADLVLDENDEKAWWVKPYIPGKTTQWSSTHVFLYSATPPPTIITSAKPILPSSETATTLLNPTFVWSLSSHSSKYQIGFESDNGQGWASFILSNNQVSCNTSQCSYTLTASQTKFKQGDIKTWWVRSLNNNNWTDWSVGSTFNIDTSRNPQDLLVLTNDENSARRLLKSKDNINFLPQNTLNPNYKMWLQAITVLDNGFYLMSHNIKTLNPVTGKKEDTYILFNLLAPNGKSIANKRLDYASHGQDLSLEKLSSNLYYVYTQRDNGGKGIARFTLDTTNIDFNHLGNNNSVELNITHNKDIVLNNRGSSTASLNEKKDKVAVVSYVSRKVLDIQLIDKESLKMENRFKLDLSDGQPNGNYNQGIAMKDNIIYIARGDWKTQTEDNIKKLFLLDATTGKLIASYSFTLQNALSYKTIEPEGLVIVGNALYVTLPTRKGGKVSIKLYKLLDI